MRDLLGLPLSAVVAFGGWWLVTAILSGPRGKAWGTAVGCACGFAAGYVWQEWPDWRPTSYWKWLPWLGFLTLLGPLAATGDRPSALGRGGRLSLWLGVAIVSAQMLVPTWADLVPARGWYVTLFAGTVWLLAILLEPLSRRTSANVLLPAMCLCTLATAGVLAPMISLRFGMLAAFAASAMSGVWLASLRGTLQAARLSPPDHWNPAAAGSLLFYAVVASGLMLAGQLAKVVPTFSFALLLSAPMALWICELPAFKGVTGFTGWMLRMLAVLVPVMASILVAVFSRR